MKSVKELLAEANDLVPKITFEEAKALLGRDDVLVVDVRDADEVRGTGKIPGALHVPRGMLEFRADPDSPYHDRAFDREKTVVLYCASGGRSALSGKTLSEMGYTNVKNMGGFKDWVESGGPVEQA